jgi:hypothetical protein
MRRAILALALIVAGSAAQAGDKSHYTLFNPTPNNLLRDMSTDRPDTTESPFTIDAGRVQIEMNLFGYARSYADPMGSITETYEFATTNIRIGLTNAAEIGIVFQPHGIARMFPPLMRSSGPGNIHIRAKFNLWGNDNFDKSGDTAFALLPYMSFPVDSTNGVSSGAVEGGLLLPLAVQLSETFGLGINAGIEAVENDAASGHHAETILTAALAQEWTDRFGTYYEVAAHFNTESGDAVVLGTGFTLALSDNVQLDAGVNFGITDAADRINPFIGVSARF